MRSVSHRTATAVVVFFASTAALAASSDAIRVAEALARYRTIAARGGWETPSAGPALPPGARHGSVPWVRTRLVATGELAASGAGVGRDGTLREATLREATLYDAALERAVRLFQRRHGLVADGVLGPATRAALAAPVEQRIAQLEQAARALARPAPARRWIRINVPRFWLEVVDGDDVVLEMPVVVGRPSRPTPALDSTISWVVLNPPWNVPPLLAYEDLLPKIRRDPGYLASRRIEIFDGSRPDARRLDPATVDWATIGPGIRDLTLRQRPGTGNALGRVLFYMDNAHDVYLHDTPSRELFRQPRRDFSSGCIRVENALGLLTEILRGDPAWTDERLDDTLDTGETVPVRVAAPVPIRVVYQTAWVDERGGVHFRDDIYREVDRLAPGAAASAGRPGHVSERPLATESTL